MGKIFTKQTAFSSLFRSPPRNRFISTTVRARAVWTAFLSSWKTALVREHVGRETCRHLCYGQGCYYGRGRRITLCCGRKNAEVGVSTFGECSFGENTWCHGEYSFLWSTLLTFNCFWKSTAYYYILGQGFRVYWFIYWSILTDWLY